VPALLERPLHGFLAKKRGVSSLVLWRGKGKTGKKRKAEQREREGRRAFLVREQGGAGGGGPG